jgi:hypothetical protein
LVAAPGVIPPHMTVESDIVGERRDDVTQSVTRGIVRGKSLNPNYKLALTPPSGQRSPSTVRFFQNSTEWPKCTFVT